MSQTIVYALDASPNSHASHMHVKDYVELYETGLNQSKMPDNSQRRARFFHLTQLLQLTRGVPGFTAEAGVFRGLSSYLICSMLRREFPTFNGETHYMLDSFEGLSKPVDADGPFPIKRFSEGAFTTSSLEHARCTMADFPSVNIRKGWIPEVLNEIPDQHYRFVHVDVDVYEPTLACLRYFYPRLSTGGILLCDDFGPWKDDNWPGCIRAINEFTNEFALTYALLDTGNVFFIKR